MGELLIGSLPFGLAPLPIANDIQIGETISFLYRGRMVPFSVQKKGVRVSLRSLDLMFAADVTYEEFRYQRNLLRQDSPEREKE